MKIYQKDGEIKAANSIVIIKDGFKIFNPSEELILADGWVEYVPPKPDEDAIFKAETEEKVKTMFFSTSIQSQTNTYGLSDKEALSVKEFYPPWKEGIDVEVGERYTLEDKLYQVDQKHTTQENWRPDKQSSLWHEVSYHEGTKEDPIPYNEEHDPQFQGMILELGKVYTQDGILYECIRSSEGVKIVQDLSGLVDNYVKIIN